MRHGYIKGIIGLPANLFYGTGIPACIIVLDKENAAARKGIFMIDAARGFLKDGNKNRLRDQDIHLIVDAFTRQLEVPRYSRLVPLAEISDPKNDFNLNLPRYIDSTEPEDLQDIDAHPPTRRTLRHAVAEAHRRSRHALRPRGRPSKKNGCRMEVKAGYKQTEVGVIPKEWEVSAFSDVFNITAGGDVDPKRSKSYQDEIHRYPIYSNALTNYSLYGYCSYGDHPAGSITITARGMIGSANFRDHPYTAIGRVLILQPKNEVAGSFFAEIINNRVKFATESTGVPQLTAPQISTYRLPVPPLPEQRAIAGALSEVDALIGALDQLIAKKRDLKQAAMQQLLTGHHRLPGFHSEWEVKRLGDVVERLVGGGTPSRNNPTFWGKEVPWVTVKDFATFHPRLTQESITRTGLKNSASHLIPAGTLITSTRMALGKAVIYQVDVAINQDLKAVFLKPTIDTHFLYYWFEHNAQMIDELGSGSTVKGISIAELRGLPFAVPSLPEQTAIAAVLTDMDAELAALEERSAKTRALKQGMMQELLTGRTRLV